MAPTTAGRADNAAMDGKGPGNSRVTATASKAAAVATPAETNSATAARTPVGETTLPADVPQDRNGPGNNWNRCRVRTSAVSSTMNNPWAVVASKTAVNKPARLTTNNRTTTNNRRVVANGPLINIKAATNNAAIKTVDKRADKLPATACRMANADQAALKSHPERISVN